MARVVTMGFVGAVEAVGLATWEEAVVSAQSKSLDLCVAQTVSGVAAALCRKRQS